MGVGKKIYYDLTSGEVLVVTGERKGNVRPTTIEHDISIYKVLSERNRDTFDVLELEYGQYAEDFYGANGYRVNPETKEIEFSYPDPNETEPTEPVYRKPLSEEVEELKAKEKLLNNQVKVLSSQNDEISDVLQEVILMMM